MKLTDIAFQAMTIEQVMHDVYHYDADTQIRAFEAPSDSNMTFAVTMNIEVPVTLARQALDTFDGNKVVTEDEQRLWRAQKAFNQNPTPAMSTIVKRLARRVMERRRGKL